MTKFKSKKPKFAKKPDATKTKKFQTKKLKKKKRLHQKGSAFPKPDNPQIPNVSDSESDSETELDLIQELLELCSKEQLITFLVDAALNDAALFNRIRETADQDVSHRKIFVHGLAWGVNRETLVSVFKEYGEIENCSVVVDRNTGKTKGYAFLLFKHRKSAVKALKEPRKMISNRIVWCQLASVGSTQAATATQTQDFSNRRVYVTSLKKDVDPVKLKAFFEKFGEIERGPSGFDPLTGKSRGSAVFVYRTVEGAKKALEEPFKMFEGQQLRCEKATDGKNKTSVGGGAASVTTSVQPMQPEVLAAMAAAQQNMAMFGQYPMFNPLYGGLVGPGTGAVALNPLMAAGGLGLMGAVGQVGAGGAAASHNLGSFGGGTSFVGPYSMTGDTGLQHAYPNAQFGQASVPKTQGTGASSDDYPYM